MAYDRDATPRVRVRALLARTLRAVPPSWSPVACCLVGQRAGRSGVGLIERKRRAGGLARPGKCG